MRFFAVLDFQYWALASFLGLTGLVFVFIAWSTYPVRRRRKTEDDRDLPSEEEALASHDIKDNPVVPFLIVVYVIAVLWAVAYMVFMGVMGPAI